MKRAPLTGFLALAGALLTACPDDEGAAPATSSGPATVGSGGADGGSTAATGGAGGETEADWLLPTGSGGCDAALYAPTTQSSPHVDECSVIAHVSNPPTSGEHYPRWAQSKTYDEAVHRGFWLHAMEHGAVVLAYNCPSGCDAEVAAMQTFVDNLDPDPDCATNRIIITPDPDLDVQFAAAAWGNMLKASCFDEALVAQFIADHYADAPEDVCGGGIDPLDPTEMIPSDCGE